MRIDSDMLRGFKTWKVSDFAYMSNADDFNDVYDDEEALEEEYHWPNGPPRILTDVLVLHETGRYLTGNYTYP